LRRYNEADRQMVLMRKGWTVTPLARVAALDMSKRFTFYDQVHTTGMDIKQAPAARAALTLGKDMTLRDYAQGAWRMRQELTLVHFSAQRKRFLWDKGCI
jgi:hypothetical protein